MKLSQFNFELPEELIAKTPSTYRDECKLMVLHKDTGEIEHRIFKDILEYASPHDLFVFNDAKIFPARLHGTKEKTQAEIEVFLLRELNSDQHLWDVLVDPARKIRIGNKLYFGDDLVAEVIDNTTSRGRTLRFLFDGTKEEFKDILYSLGELPVPKWIRPHANELDKERFQTIYANPEHEGAVACPAAGLHFSKTLLKRMEINDIDKAFLTLYMGNAHFHQVDVEDLSKHKMDSEQMIITEETAETINKARRGGHKIFAVGITVIRALETYVTTTREVRPFDGWTNKFIFPPYSFSIPDAIITNFHLPLSTMLMNAAAFGGFENVMNAYKVAIDKKYKFGTYGDAMLII